MAATPTTFTAPDIPTEKIHVEPIINITYFLDREERAVAALLTRFRNLVTLAAMPAVDGAAKEVAASHAFQSEVESNALVQAAEDLLQLTRELKEMWLAGPLRAVGEDEEDDKMGADARKVGEMVDGILKRASEMQNGSG